MYLLFPQTPLQQHFLSDIPTISPLKKLWIHFFNSHQWEKEMLQKWKKSSYKKLPSSLGAVMDRLLLCQWLIFCILSSGRSPTNGPAESVARLSHGTAGPWEAPSNIHQIRCLVFIGICCWWLLMFGYWLPDSPFILTFVPHNETFYWKDLTAKHSSCWSLTTVILLGL